MSTPDFGKASENGRQDKDAVEVDEDLYSVDEEESDQEENVETADDASEQDVEARLQALEERVEEQEERLKQKDERIRELEAILGKSFLEKNRDAEPWKKTDDGFESVNLFNRVTSNTDRVDGVERSVEELEERAESNIIQAAGGEMSMQDGPEKRAMFLAERFGEISYKIPAAESALGETQLGVTTKTLDSRDKTTVNKIFDEGYDEDLQAVQVANAMKKAAEMFPDKLEFRDPSEDRYKYLLYSGGD
jgi:hypothetical protein